MDASLISSDPAVMMGKPVAGTTTKWDYEGEFSCITRCHSCDALVYKVPHMSGSICFDFLGPSWPIHSCFQDDTVGSKLRVRLSEVRRVLLVGVVVETIITYAGNSGYVVIKYGDRQQFEESIIASADLTQLPGCLTLVAIDDNGHSRLYWGPELLQRALGTTSRHNFLGGSATCLKMIARPTLIVAEQKFPTQLPTDEKVEVKNVGLSFWMLVINTERYYCDVPYRENDKLVLRFAVELVVSIGCLGILIGPGGNTRLIIEVSETKSTNLIVCLLIGVASVAPPICLECGKVLNDRSVVMGMPGQERILNLDICQVCWEVYTARQLRMHGIGSRSKWFEQPESDSEWFDEFESESMWLAKLKTDRW